MSNAESKREANERMIASGSRAVAEVLGREKNASKGPFGNDLGDLYTKLVQEAGELADEVYAGSIDYAKTRAEAADTAAYCFAIISACDAAQPSVWSGTSSSVNTGTLPAATHEPAPTGNGTAILPLVLADLSARSAAGERKYGTPLRAFNGRDALMDAYQEACDLVMYIRQELYERDGR